MTRALGALAGHVTARTLSLSRCVRVDLLDGTVVGFTDHDRTLSVDLGDGAADYVPSKGVAPSNIVLSTGFESDNLELAGPLRDDGITAAAVLGGRLGRAAVRIFDANWRAPAQWYPLLSGHVADYRVEGGRFVLGVRGLQDAWNQTIGALITPFCRADFGDAQCGVVVEEAAALVTAVADDMTFTVAGGVATEGYYNLGHVEFTSGDLAGTRPMEVFSYTAAGVVTMYLPLAAAPAIGDALVLRRGCDKTRETCRDVYSNMVNFRGEPDLPGNDQAFRMPIPGAGGTAV